jgi:SsrA-binding protein
MSEKNLATNRKATFEYFLLEHFEAGLALHGSEIKSLRLGQASLAEAYISVEENLEAWLINAHIAPYDAASHYNHDPKRPRRLLLHKKEIRELRDSIRLKGMTIIPVKIYLKDGRAKLDMAIAKGKKLYDKRATIADRDAQREAEREHSGRFER